MPKKVVFITGKGGVGKTTVTCQLAKQWSGSARCRILEQSLDHSVAHTFQQNGVFDQHTPIHERLDTINVSPMGCYQSFLKHEFQLNRAFLSVMQSKGMYSMVRMLPGVFELLLLGRIIFESKDVDHLIFDGYSSGHFLKVLSTPNALSKIKLGGRIQELVDKIVIFLKEHCEVYVVSLLENYALDETQELSKGILALNLCPINRIVLNRVYYGTTDIQYQCNHFYQEQQNILEKYVQNWGSNIDIGICRIATPPSSIEVYP